MDKYKLAGFRGEGGQASFRSRLHKSFPRFLAYCGVMQACRSVPQFRRREPYAIGLSVSGDADFDVYCAAAQYAAHGPAIVHGGDDDTEIVTRNGSPWTKAKEMELLATSAKHRRVLVLVDKGVGFPESFRLAADGIVAAGPILPRHVIAGAKLCLNAEVTTEQAEFIASVPLAVISAAMRPGRSITHAIGLMRKAIKPQPKEVSGPTLDDLHGLGEAGDWGRELVADLADWRAGKIGWEDVDRGILLSGPPGTGKTTFAGALARTCGVRLVLGSLARWQAKGHLGDLLKAMRGAFDEARENAPSIIFLDEIDAVGDREKFTGDSAQYCTEVVAALLECIDGAEAREGVVIVGACNHPHRLDAALVRAGRLDRHICIPLPDQKGREGILRWHLQGLLPDADLSGVVAVTEGWSGASLEQLVRQARRRARRGRREMVLEDLDAELPSPVPIPPEMRRRAAVHEAGHAIVALALASGELVSVSVESAVLPNPGAFQKGGGVVFRDKGIKERTHAQLLDSIAVRLGGLAAEEVVLGERSAGGGGGRGSDLHTATLSALAFEASYGLGEGFAYLAPDDEEELFSALRLDRLLHARIDRMLLEQFRRAKRIVERERLEIERVSEALLVKGSLSAEEVREIVGRQPRLRLAGDGSAAT